jgi:iron complex outermembrane receptor protein
MRVKTLFAAASAIALVSAPAFAQAIQTAPQTGGVRQAAGSAITTETGDVIVTARKREERLKDVPIAVTDVTASTLATEQINQVKDIAAFAPGLTINSDAVGRSFVSIRGVGTTLIDTVQPGVGIFIDGIYEPNTSYLNTPLLDVDRIEVLRGPQGTLFGNNTLGGAISVITRQPTDTLHVVATAAYAGPDDYRTTGISISGPLIPGLLQGRIGYSSHDQDGFESNSIAGGHADPLHQRSTSAELRYEPTSWAVVTANVAFDEVRGGITPYIDLTGPKDYSEVATLNLNSIAHYNYTRVNLKGDFDIAALKTKVTTVVAYDQRDGLAYGDGDFGPVDYLRSNGSNNKLETTSGEIRFDTQFNSAFSSLIGAYAYHSTYDTKVYTEIVPFDLTIPAFQFDTTDAEALFGTVFWKIDPSLEFAIGLRYDHQRVTIQGQDQHFAANELEPRFTLTKHWTSDLMTYASISRGFRGGGINPPGSPNLIYQGDSVWTYELGVKLATLNRKLSVEADVFYNDYDNFIGQNSLAPSTIVPGSFVAINLNTGHVTSYGAELEAQYRPTERWAFSTGITLEHARITDGSEYVETTGMPLPSDRILFLPDWNFFVDGNYSHPIGADILRFDATVIGKGDRIGSTLSPASVPVLSPYFLVNGTIGYIHGHIEFDLFATNLFNTKYLESYLDSSLLTVAGFPPALSHNLGIQGDRRRVGIRATYKF